MLQMFFVISISGILDDRKRACFHNKVLPRHVCEYFHLYWMNKYAYFNDYILSYNNCEWPVFDCGEAMLWCMEEMVNTATQKENKTVNKNYT